MRILVINGNPKKEGFIAGALDIISRRLEQKGCDVTRLHLADANIRDCQGCFQCLKTGSCALDDDMRSIIEDMRGADGFVIGSPVRNGLTTACYKRFYERITYPLGFPFLLEGKHTLAVSSVGFAGGRSVNKKLLGLRSVGPRLSDYLFFRVGIPSRLDPDAIRPRLEKAADRLVRNIELHKPPRWAERIFARIDRFVMSRFMFAKSPEQYAFVIQTWREKGYLR